MPIDSLSYDTSVTVSSWNLFVAAMTSNEDLRTNIISSVHNRASYNLSAGAFPLNYDSTHGSTILGVASPAQGAMYAPLALAAPIVQITFNATSSSSKATSHTSAIAGGTAGGVAALILVGGAVAFVRRKRRQDDFDKSTGASFSSLAIEPHSQMAVTPFNPALAEAAPLEIGPPLWTMSDRPFSTSEPTPSQTAPPVGLTGKELARLRSESTPTMLSPPSHTQSSSSVFQPTVTPAAGTTDQSVVISATETRRLQTEVESLRLEMQQLELRVRLERFEPSPSYGDGGGV